MATYTEQQLISFGEYLLSKERKDNLEKHPTLGETNISKRLETVSDADIENWKEKAKIIDIKYLTLHDSNCSFRLYNLICSFNFNKNAFEKENHKITLSDIAKFKRSDYNRQRGMGEKMITELTNLLTSANLKFAN